MEYYLESVASVLQNLKADENGLTEAEAAKRLLENGRNELDKTKKKSLLRRFAEQLINPMIIVLLIAAAVSIVLAAVEGESFIEGIIILTVVVLNSVLGVFQESKAEKAIEALSGMSAATAKVRRDGAVYEIPAAELVKGDVVLIEAGDSVPADMRLTHSVSLKIEEAALTGESVPSEKMSQTLRGDSGGRIPLGDRKNMAYMGSGISYGRGEGVVTAVGMSTEMGKIAKIIQDAEEGETPLQKRLSQLSKILSVIVLGICVVIFAVRLISSGEYNAAGITASFMLAISLAVAAIPEGLAAVVTIVLSIGVTNMAKRRAIIRKLTAVETLGCAQIICSDKTGTLTQNKMTVMETYGDAALLIKGMALCCDSSLSEDGTIIGDPTENALIAYAIKEGVDIKSLKAKNPRIAEAPFDSVRKMMSTVHQSESRIFQYTKGAPDEVLRICTHVLEDGKTIPLTEEIKQKIADKNKEYAHKALRVLACAYKTHDAPPSDCSPENLENGLTFVGLEAMADPVRPEVKAAVDSCKGSGIKVVMITGDHKETAAAIAIEIGIIENINQAVTGRELDDLNDEEFEKRIETIFVYARVQPEHKVRIVNMWKKKGYITAMTGDGVNDAPAIKSGDIGVGMGITGTDVTKNVADMVLADDNFATIVSAVEEGRRIYDNIRKTIQFLLSTNLSEILVIFAATLSGFVLFKPIHLLFINLITDSLPAMALGMEYAQDDIMKRPPRGQKEGIFSDGLGVNIIYQGIVIAVITLLSFVIVNLWQGNAWNTSGAAATTAAFFTLSMCEFFHAFCMRCEKKSIFTLKKQNKMLWFATVLSLALTLLIIYVPFLAEMFSLVPLKAGELAVSFGLAMLVVPVIEAVKAIQHSKIKAQ